MPQRIDELPADQRAVLQLLLQQGKTYEELSGLLRIEPDAGARARARRAGRLGPGDGARPGARAPGRDRRLPARPAERRRPRRDARGCSRAPPPRAPGRAAWPASCSRAESPPRTRSRRSRPTAPRRPPARRPRLARQRGAQATAAATRAQAAPRAARTPRTEGSARARRGASQLRMGGLLLLAAVGAAIAILIIVVIPGGDDDKAGTSAQRARTQTDRPAGRSSARSTSTRRPTRARRRSRRSAGAPGRRDRHPFQGQGIPPTKTGDVYALWVARQAAAWRAWASCPAWARPARCASRARCPDAVNLADFDSCSITRETTANPHQARARSSCGRAPTAPTVTPPSRKQQLAGVHDPGGIEALLDRAQRVEAERAGLGLQVGHVVAADRVVVGDRAAGGDDRLAGGRAWPRATARSRRRGPARARNVKYSEAPVG